MFNLQKNNNQKSTNQGVKGMINKIKDAVAYVPRRIHVAIVMMALMPVASYADGTVVTSGGIFAYLTSLLAGVGQAKTFFWGLAGAVGAIGAAYGFIMLMVINSNPDYRGKMTKGHCIKMMCIGIIVASASVYFTMIASSLGATDAVTNATSDTFTGFTS